MPTSANLLPNRRLLIGLALLFALVWLGPKQHTVFEGIAKYQSVHLPIETLSIVVSMMIFGVVWNAYSRERAANLVLIACGSLAVGLIDFAHMLSFAGMPDWVTPSDPEKAINFWLAARLTFALTILTVALRPWTPFQHSGRRYWLLAAALVLSALTYWIGLYHQHSLPRTFIAGSGLTAVKIAAEYAIVALLALAAFKLWQQYRQGQAEAAGLFTATVVTILSELSFTLYSDVTDVFNLLGHVYKVFAYFFIYRAVFVSSVHEPFRRVVAAEAALRVSEERYASLTEVSPVGVFQADEQGELLYVNQRWSEIAGMDAKLALGKGWLSGVHPEDIEMVTRTWGQAIAAPQPLSMEFRFRHADGGIAWVYAQTLIMHNRNGSVSSHIGTLTDITEQKLATHALQARNRALKTLSTGNHALVHASTEDELLDRMCRAAVLNGGYRLVWVGLTQDGKPPLMHAAQYAADPGYIQPGGLIWEDQALDHSPVGLALGRGETQICQDIAAATQYTGWREQALLHGGAACLCLPLNSSYQVPLGVLVIYAAASGAFNQDEIALLTEMSEDLAFGLTTLRIRTERDLAVAEQQHFLDKLQRGLQDTVQAIAATVEVRDPYTAGHQRRVAELAAAIGGEMDLPHERIYAIHLAGIVHDLGKISIPAEILSKPGKLSKIEYELIQQHPQAGYEILKGIEFPWPIAEFVLQHHERMDGSGYPQSLKGEAIHLESRILAVADVVEAIASHRPYRPSLGIEAALEEIGKKRGVQFDADVVDAALRLFREKGYRLEDTH